MNPITEEIYLKGKCLKEKNVIKQELHKNRFLLNTFIYLYLIKQFKKVEFYLNEDKVDDAFTKELFDKIDMLNEVAERGKKKYHEKQNSMNNETNEIREDENIRFFFNNVDKIIINESILESTKQEALDFPFNLVKLKIEIDLINNIVQIKSYEYTLIKKNWNYTFNQILDKKTYDEIEKRFLEIYFKDNTPEHVQMNILMLLADAINKHSLFCETGYDTIKENRVIENNMANPIIDEKENEILKKELRLEKNVEYSDINKIKDEINNVLFSLHEPAFYNVSIKKENEICYKKMYNLFKNIMIKSRVLKINKELIAYLLCEYIFLPDYVSKNKFKNVDEDVYSSLSSYSDNSSRKEKDIEKVENNEDKEYKEDDKNKNESEKNSFSDSDISCEVSENSSNTANIEDNKKKKKKKKLKDLFADKNFRDILENIKDKIEELNNSVFLRVNWKNLKSGSFVNDYNLEVRTLYDALLMLKSATSVFKILKKNKNKNNYLILSKYVNINICFLFDVYVYNHEIIAVSQKYLNYYFSFLNDPDVIIDTLDLLKTFFDKNLKNSFPFENYTCQLYIHSFKKTNKKKIVLINAKSWIYKNKHPIFTNQFLKHYIHTKNKGVNVTDENFNKKNVYKFRIDLSNNKKESNEKNDIEKETPKSDNYFDFYCYDDIPFFCIHTDDSIYKKNANIYPKDMSYVKEGEIDIDKLMETMKRDNNIQKITV